MTAQHGRDKGIIKTKRFLPLVLHYYILNSVETSKLVVLMLLCESVFGRHTPQWENLR